MLPTPDATAQAHSAALSAQIAHAIEHAGGWISFAQYMELALYMPTLGYYSGGASKFGAAGDFVTAPTISPLFGQTLATTFAHFFNSQPTLPKQILEFGAGTGLLAAEILNALGEQQNAPSRYFILELSGSLRARQQETIATHAPQWLEHVTWLDHLPEDNTFCGVMFGNEVLDAMPVQVFTIADHAVFERGVHLQHSNEHPEQVTFAWQNRPADARLTESVRALETTFGSPFATGYTSEICHAAQGFMHSLAASMQAGLLLMIDYGFPAREYYHAQRSAGTLMCHYRHHAHGDPFFYPGLQDITAHVDFSAIADCAQAAGLQLLGYTSQARALLNGGLLTLASQLDRTDTIAYLQATRGLQTLLAESEMGELFKVIGFTKNLEAAADCPLLSAGLRYLGGLQQI